jgi:hypothetical protein
LLEDAEWGKWSDREIARRCNVSRELVGDLRPSSVISDRCENEPRKVERNGTVYTQNTANIGRKPEPEPEPAQVQSWQTSEPMLAGAPEL